MTLKSVTVLYPDHASIALAYSKGHRTASDGFDVRQFVEGDCPNGAARQLVEQTLQALDGRLIEVIDSQDRTIRRTVWQILKFHGGSSRISKPLSAP